MEENKTLIRWVGGCVIMFLLMMTIVLSSINYSNIKIGITSDSNSYNITKVLMNTMTEISKTSDYNYKLYLDCKYSKNNTGEIK